MPRTRRIVPDNSVHHVLNRRNRREVLFKEDADYAGFLDLIPDAIDRSPVKILVWAAMPTHFHFVVWVNNGGELSAFMHWLTTAHVHQHHHRHGTTGEGHIYQGRFKNFLVQTSTYLYRVLRYVEANPLRAKLVDHAEDWRWSSLRSSRAPDGRQICSAWPLARPADWLKYVNQGIPADELSALRHSATRGAPYGDDYWISDTARRYGLESTIRIHGRPKKGTGTFSPFE